MDIQFEEIFRRRVGDYLQNASDYYNGFRPRRYPGASTNMLLSLLVNQKIQDWNRLRTDAQYFLLLNFGEMILEPVIESGFWDLRNENELEDLLVSDMNTIVQDSVKNSKEKLVSGHEIILTLNRQWEKLKLMSKHTWKPVGMG